MTELCGCLHLAGPRDEDPELKEQVLRHHLEWRCRSVGTGICRSGTRRNASSLVGIPAVRKRLLISKGGSDSEIGAGPCAEPAKIGFYGCA